jgi:hypothetical protein
MASKEEKKDDHQVHMDPTVDALLAQLEENIYLIRDIETGDALMQRLEEEDLQDFGVKDLSENVRIGTTEELMQRLRDWRNEEIIARASKEINECFEEVKEELVQDEEQEETS